MGSRGQSLSKLPEAINTLFQQLCKDKKEVGFVGLFCWEGRHVHEG